MKIFSSRGVPRKMSFLFCMFGIVLTSSWKVKAEDPGEMIDVRVPEVDLEDAIDNNGEQEGEGVWIIEIPAPPSPSPPIEEEAVIFASDTCEASMEVQAFDDRDTGGGNGIVFTHSGSTQDASQEGATAAALSCLFLDETSKTIWYRLLPDAEYCYTVSTLGSDFDTVLAVAPVVSDSCNDYKCEMENDDAAAVQGTNTLVSMLEFQPDPAISSYWIVLAGHEASAGDFELLVSREFCGLETPDDGEVAEGGSTNATDVGGQGSNNTTVGGNDALVTDPTNTQCATAQPGPLPIVVRGGALFSDPSSTMYPSATWAPSDMGSTMDPSSTFDPSSTMDPSATWAPSDRVTDEATGEEEEKKEDAPSVVITHPHSGAGDEHPPGRRHRRLQRPPFDFVEPDEGEHEDQQQEEEEQQEEEDFFPFPDEEDHEHETDAPWIPPPPEEEFDECFYFPPGWDGRWYSFQGNEECVKVTVQPSAPLQIGVLQGPSCTNKRCLASNWGDDFWDDGTQNLFFRAEANKTYYVVVRGGYWFPEEAMTFFEMDIEAFPCPANVDCPAAVTIDTLPASVEGTTTLARNASHPSSWSCSWWRDFKPSQVLWYELEPSLLSESDDECMEVSLSMYGDALLGVYKGDNCGAMTCVAQPDNRTWLSNNHVFLWDPEPNTTYHVAVAAAYGTTDYFELNVSPIPCPIVPDNQNCTTAKLVTQDQFVENGTVAYADLQLVEWGCSRFNSYYVRPMWYKVVGRGGCLRANYTAETYSYGLSIAMGDECSDIDCVVEVPFRGEMNNSLSWFGEDNVTYYVVLGSEAYSRIGGFSLEIAMTDNCPRLPSNNECEDAEPIVSLPAEITLDMALAKSEDEYLDSFNCYVPHDHKSVWYSMTFENRTCVEVTPNANFYGSLTLWQGSCIFPTCESQIWFDNYGETKQTLSFVAEPNREYKLLVSADSYAFDWEFTLKIEELQCPESATCETAAVIDDFPYVSSLSTAFSSGESSFSLGPGFACSGLNRDTRSNWYVLPEASNPGSCMTIFLWAAYSTFMAVYSGDSCGSLTCVAQETRGDGVLQVVAPPNTTLYMLVGGSYSSEYGDYVFAIDDDGDCPEPTDNYVCSAAKEISSIEDSIEGNLESVPQQGNVISSGNCYISTFASALWYKLPEFADPTCLKIGMNTLRTSYGTQIFVLSADDCSDFECEGFAYRGQNEVTLKVLPDNGDYYIVVVSERVFGETDDFTISISEMGCVANDEFENAISVSKLPFLEASTFAFSAGEPYSWNSGPFTCNRLDQSVRSNWYRLQGNGTCVSLNVLSDYSDFAAVYTGDSYDSLSCLAQEEYNEEPLKWFAEDGTTYSILVGGSDGASGEYAMELVEDDDCPEPVENDVCEMAEMISSIPFRTESSSQLAVASPYYSLGNCYLGSGTKLLWYEVDLNVTSGTCLRAEVDIQSYGSILALSGNSCSRLSCLKQEYGSKVSASWRMEDSTNYWIIVSGEDEGQDFELTLDDVDCPDYNVCSMAASIASLPFIDRTSNEFATQEPHPMSAYTCNEFPRQGQGSWYAFQGNGCTTVSMYATFSTYIAIFIGDDCDIMECLREELYGDRTLTFFAESNVTYRIFTGSAWDDSSDEYTVAITSGDDCPVAPPENDHCDAATQIVALPFSSSDSYTLASGEQQYLSFGNCYIPRSWPTVWYIYQAVNVTCVRATLSSGNPGDVLTVYSGSRCDGYSCIGQRQYSPHYVSWKTEPDQTYYILVSGGYSFEEGDGGDFVVSLDEVDCVGNDRCPVSTHITSLPYVDVSSNEFAVAIGETDWERNSCWRSTMERKSLWYNLVGEGPTCDEMSCFLTEQYQDNTVRFLAQENVTYKIAVGGYDTGEVALTVTDAEDCPEAPSNDDCASAELVDKLPYTGQASTELASFEDAFNECLEFKEYRSVWFKLVLNSTSCVRADLSSYSYNAILAAFAGSDCQAEICIGNPYRGNNRRVSFKATEGNNYYVVVLEDGFSTGGPVDLFFTEGECVENDSIETASPVKSLPYLDDASLEFSVPRPSIDESFSHCDLIGGNTGVNYYELSLGNSNDTCISVSILSTRETVLAIYRRDVSGSVRCAAQQTIYGYSTDRSIDLSVKAGASYIVAVGSSYWNSDGGDYLLSIQEKEKCPSLPSNDNCTTAELIESIPFEIGADYEYAQPFNDYLFLGSCEIYYDARVLWYELAPASEDACLWASIDSGSSSRIAISIFQGDSCGNQTCLGGTYQDYSPSLAWKAKAGEKYIVAVSGDSYSSSTTFTLSITEIECVANDECASSQTISAIPFIESSSTEVSSMQEFMSANFSASLCPSIDSFSRTNWYAFTPSLDACMVASVFADSSSALAVHSGSDCDTMSCVSYRWSWDEEQSVSWRAKAGVTYWLTVGASYGRGGEYIISLDEAGSCDDIPSNDECALSTSITLPFTDSSDTAFVTPLGEDIIDGVGECFLGQNYHVLWYSFTPTESGCVDVKFVTNKYASFTIFSGSSCGDLNCVKQSYDMDDEVVLETEANTAYYFAIADDYPGDDSVVFSFEVTTTECVSNIQCDAAEVVDEIPFFGYSTTSVISVPDPKDVDAATVCGGVPMSGNFSSATWYELQGTGQCLSALVWSEVGAFLAVYEGNGCDDMSCLVQGTFSGRNALDTTKFQTKQNETYRLLVSKQYEYSGTGDYVLTIVEDDECPGIAPNSHCSSAQLIESLPSMIDGDTTNATMEGRWISDGFCYLSENQKSLWYEVAVTNSSCAKATIASVSSEVGLYVFTGSSCSDLLCDGQGFVGSSVTWPLDPDSPSYIVVTGGYGGRFPSIESEESFQFTLEVEDADCADVSDPFNPPPNSSSSPTFPPRWP